MADIINISFKATGETKTIVPKTGLSPHSIKNFVDLNLQGIPCLLIDCPHNKDWGPLLRIYSLDYDEIEYAYNLGQELFNNFEKLLC